MDYAQLRERMVQEQICRRGIKDEKILDIFRKIERHRFVSPELSASAYGDFPLSIGSGQTISQPYIVALMTDALALSGEERVLEIGTGSGYQAAILAGLAKEVYSVERLGGLAKKAAGLLEELGIRNVKIHAGDGTLGWPEQAPFDRIIVTAAAAETPAPLLEQLKEGGKLILPLGGPLSQILTLADKKEDGSIEYRQICDCVFVPLISQ
ncbi:MAG: protein-L-isoaspartate(D-aspartate) O-methyltransferase [Candidatus Omnitrophota bacterium]|nr:protein-L-isoaspartate(D-aspartate) O-methyltransferase [Candidatus Omnitrophota bacterium]